MCIQIFNVPIKAEMLLSQLTGMTQQNDFDKNQNQQLTPGMPEWTFEEQFKIGLPSGGQKLSDFQF